MDVAEDAIEGQLMKRLYGEYGRSERRVFCSRAKEKEEELIFYRHLLTLGGFLKPGHLKIEDKDISAFTLLYLAERTAHANVEISQVHQYRTPKDKMTVLINFVTVIMKSVGKKESNNEYIPFIVYYLIRTEPMMLKSTLRFIKQFRSSQHFAVEKPFYHLVAASVAFIEKIGHSDFRITLEEFESRYSLCEKLCSARLEEQLCVWKSGATFVAGEKAEKEERRQRLVREVQTLLGKVRKSVGKEFGKLTVAQLKEIIDVQAQIAERIKNLA